jgi:nucleoside 2-deoxyribosyltransferase
MNTYTLYMAGPVKGLAYGPATDWRHWLADKLADYNVECLDPLRGKDELQGETSIDRIEYDTPLSCPKGIYVRDRFDALRCDLLLVNLRDAEKPSLGSVMEIAWADALHKPIILVMEPGNVHEHAMVLGACGFRAQCLEEAAAIAVAVLNLKKGD